ncbi:EKC/KEOPS complex subunit Tprkb [Lingula anatina]|uniref:EKC/KEOPS complex subunit Tprkb n=1 Tax=Lingula anatina TaxID=7574 RepID=A0A1S3JFE3_LINAN|nr:EKC/KEOPS complex subunit Tprkb [Lingula anatina]|eukprot:XP_013408871.1 EKC/KEOPS complex subunit Tprkb [Lingula anatina]
MGLKSYENFLGSNLTLSIVLYKDVRNLSEVRKLVIEGKFEAALIKPSVVVDPFQVLVAVNKAVHLHSNNKKYTRTLHSEILYSLAPSKNISDSYKKFGVTDQETSVLIVSLAEESTKPQDFLSVIQGQQVALESLPEFTDLDTVKKVYKIPDIELSIGTVLEAVVNRIASKDIVSL